MSAVSPPDFWVQTDNGELCNREEIYIRSGRTDRPGEAIFDGLIFTARYEMDGEPLPNAV